MMVNKPNQTKFVFQACLHKSRKREAKKKKKEKKKLKAVGGSLPLLHWCAPDQ